MGELTVVECANFQVTHIAKCVELTREEFIEALRVKRLILLEEAKQLQLHIISLSPFGLPFLNARPTRSKISSGVNSVMNSPGVKSVMNSARKSVDSVVRIQKGVKTAVENAVEKNSTGKMGSLYRSAKSKVPRLAKKLFNVKNVKSYFYQNIGNSATQDGPQLKNEVAEEEK